MSIFKAYDIRGIYGQDLTQDVFYKIARAYAQFCGFPGRNARVTAASTRSRSSTPLRRASWTRAWTWSTSASPPPR